MCTSNTADICNKALLLLSYLSFTLLTALCPGTVVGEGIKSLSVIITILQTYQPDSLKILHLNNANRQRGKKKKKYFLIQFIYVFDLEPKSSCFYLENVAWEV